MVFILYLQTTKYTYHYGLFETTKALALVEHLFYQSLCFHVQGSRKYE